MATVKIDIPEFGTVLAENAASEDTLLAILAAMEKESGGNSKKAKADEEATEAAKAKADADKKGAKAGKEFNVGLNSAADGAAKALKNISLTAVSLVTNFATNFAETANNPIKATAAVLDTLIDGVAKTATSITDAIPVIGGFISAMVNATAELAKAANKTFADQLQKNIDTLQAYNKAGVSFVGGMNEMNTIAHDAGMSLVDLSKVVSQNKETLNKMGLAGGEAAAVLGKAMGVAAKQTNKAGMTLRDEMFKMGYSYEEQGAVFSSFMANMAASGKLRNMSDKEIAEGTRRYATDLKVISDITGQDAKKLVDKARAEATRGALLVKLQGDQKDAFIKANSMLAKAGPDAQQAVTEMLTFGKVIDPKLAAQQELVKMATDVAKEVQSGNKDIVNSTTASLVQLNKDLTTGQGAKFGEALDRGLVARVTGTGSEAAQSRNQLMANLQGMFDPDAAKKSAAANEAQAANADALADSTAKLYAQTKQQEVEMEKLVNEHLPKYAKLLKEVNDQLAGNFLKYLKKTFGSDVNMTDEEKAQVTAKKQEKNAFGLPAANGDDEHILQGIKVEQWMKSQGITKAPGGVYFDKNGKNLGISLENVSGYPKFDKGGRLGANQMGIAGENGPELIGGPSSVLSRASTDSLIKAIDAMREMKGVRFGESGFDQQVGMNEGRMAKLKDRAKGFEGLDYKQLQEEFMKRPEAEPIKRAMKQMDDDERGDAMAETNTHLAEIAKLMKQNVNQTAKVAANTN